MLLKRILVHRFVNNCTNHVGCGVECAGLKTQAQRATLRLLGLCNQIRRQVSGTVISKTMYQAYSGKGYGSWLGGKGECAFAKDLCKSYGVGEVAEGDKGDTGGKESISIFAVDHVYDDFCITFCFFGGTAKVGLAASLSGVVLFATLYGSATLKMNSLIQTMFCSAVTSISVMLLVGIGIGVHPDKIMIGNIMLVIPGIQLTNSLRDMISGDMISGLLNMSEALMKAISVAMGFAMGVLFGGGIWHFM